MPSEINMHPENPMSDSGDKFVEYDELLRRLCELEKAQELHDRVEEALRSSEEHYREIFENA